MKSKRCTKCKKIKGLDLFWRVEKYKEERRRECIDCTVKINLRWRENNRKLVSEINYRSKKKHWDKVLARCRAANHRIKIEVLMKYGKGKGCVCCGELEISFLTLDHIKDNGKEDRKINGAGWKLYRRLKSLGFPKGYQTLCFNCNWGKRIGKGFCPHHPKKDLRSL